MKIEEGFKDSAKAIIEYRKRKLLALRHHVREYSEKLKGSSLENALKSAYEKLNHNLAALERFQVQTANHFQKAVEDAKINIRPYHSSLFARSESTKANETLNNTQIDETSIQYKHRFNIPKDGISSEEKAQTEDFLKKIDTSKTKFTHYIRNNFRHPVNLSNQDGMYVVRHSIITEPSGWTRRAICGYWLLGTLKTYYITSTGNPCQSWNEVTSSQGHLLRPHL